MLEKIKELVIEKFGELEADQLDHIAGRIAKKATTEEEATEQVKALTARELMQSYADMRVNKASTKKDPKGAKADPKSTTNEETKDDQKDDDDSTPAWAKALIESNKALTEKVQKMEGEKITHSRTQRLNEKIKDLPTSIQKAYQRMDISTIDDEAFGELLTEVESEVKGTLDEIKKSGATFGTPKHKGVDTTEGGAVKEATKEEVDEIYNLL